MAQTPQKKAYDREYDHMRYDEYREAKDRLTEEVFDGACELCGETEGHTEFHLHHIVYHPVESDYKRNSKSQYTRARRLAEATEHPERFKLLCPADHRMITTLGNHIIRKLKAAGNKRNVDPYLLLNMVKEEVMNRMNEVYTDD